MEFHILTNYICCVILLTLGLYTIVIKRNILKTVIGLCLLDYGVNLLIVSIGYNRGGTAPIFTAGELVKGAYFVDPIPQALTLTSIVIGACVMAMALAIVIKLHSQYHTLDPQEIRRLRG